MSNRIFTILVFIITSIALCCCTNRVKPYNHTAVIVELGNDFYYLGDGGESQILLNLKPEAKSKVGKTIIPPEVIRYNFNENFIIAQTVGKVSGKEAYKYWIVEKNKMNQDSITHLDSISFYKNLDILHIKIKLESRK
jgi:hypothetical protein